MMSNGLLRMLLIVPVWLFVACTTTDTDMNMDVDEKTTIGAATGGVVGASLGAIVGNQVGNTGSGLAIGALAGAGSGALVGNALDGQDSRMRAQDEVLQNQERQIAAQKSEMDELRQMGSDNMQFKDQLHNSLDTGSRQFGANSQQHVGGSTLNNTRASYSWPTRPGGTPQGVASRQYARADINRAPPLAPRDLSNNSLGMVKHQAATARAESVMEKDLVADSYQPPAPHAAFGQQGSSQTVANGWVQPQIRNADASNPTTGLAAGQAAGQAIETVSMPAEVLQPVTEDQLVPLQGAIFNETDNQAGGAQKLANANLNSPECKQASDEAGSARAAADPADKLFHYRRALRLCPENADYHNDLGQVYLSLNRQEDAKFEFQEALRIDPDHTRAKSSLGSI